MTDFMASGLLWYDDEKGRPVALKITDAACRYRERVGFEPTVCHVHPSQAAAGIVHLGAAATIPGARTGSKRAGRAERSTQTRRAASKLERGRQNASVRDTVVPAITLTLVQNERLRPNYFFVGIADGQEPVPVDLPSTDYDGSANDVTSSAPRRRRQTLPARPAVASQPPATPHPAIDVIAAPVSGPAERKPRTAKQSSVATSVSTPPTVVAAAAASSRRVASTHPTGTDAVKGGAPKVGAPTATAASKPARTSAQRSTVAVVAPAPKAAPTAVPARVEGTASAVSVRRPHTTAAATPSAKVPTDVKSSPRRVRTPRDAAASAAPSTGTKPRGDEALPVVQVTPAKSRQRTTPAATAVHPTVAATAKPDTVKPDTVKPDTVKPDTVKPAKAAPAKVAEQAVALAPRPMSRTSKRSAVPAATQSAPVTPPVPTPLSGKRRMRQTREETAVATSHTGLPRRRATAAKTSGKAPAAAQGQLWSA